MDVSAIPIRRGNAVARAAHSLGARGFTADGIVHIPDHAGSLDSRDAAPLLAHELTHAVQQQRFGAALPSPGSALDRSLENEAVAVEEWVGNGAVGAPPLVVRQLAPADRGRESDDDLPSLDTSSLIRDFEQETGTPFTLRPEDHRLTDVSMGGLLAAYQDLRQLAADQADSADPPGPPTTAEKPDKPDGHDDPDETGDTPSGQSIDDLMDLIADNPPRRWLDLDDSDNFEEIANRLYNHLIGRLRFDVLVERERSGTLLDFS